MQHVAATVAVRRRAALIRINPSTGQQAYVCKAPMHWDPMDESATAASGLSEAEAATRLKSDGYNELPTQGRRSIVRILADVLREPMFALLLGAAAVYLAIGSLKEAIVLVIFATTSVSIAMIRRPAPSACLTVCTS